MNLGGKPTEKSFGHSKVSFYNDLDDLLVRKRIKMYKKAELAVIENQRFISTQSAALDSDSELEEMDEKIQREIDGIIL